MLLPRARTAERGKVAATVTVVVEANSPHDRRLRPRRHHQLVGRFEGPAGAWRQTRRPGDSRRHRASTVSGARGISLLRPSRAPPGRTSFHRYARTEQPELRRVRRSDGDRPAFDYVPRPICPLRQVGIGEGDDGLEPSAGVGSIREDAYAVVECEDIGLVARPILLRTARVLVGVRRSFCRSAPWEGCHARSWRPRRPGVPSTVRSPDVTAAVHWDSTRPAAPQVFVAQD